MGLDDIGLLDADLDIAVGDSRRNELAFDDLYLVLDLIVDAELLKHPGVERAGAGIGMANRLSVEHRLLECLGRADVGLRRAGFDGDAVADFGIFDRSAGDNLAALDQSLICARPEDTRSPSPALTFCPNAGPPWKLTITLLPVAFSNAVASSRTPDSVA